MALHLLRPRSYVLRTRGTHICLRQSIAASIGLPATICRHHHRHLRRATTCHHFTTAPTPTPQQLSHFLLTAGSNHFNAGEHDQAEICFRKSLRLLKDMCDTETNQDAAFLESASLVNLASCLRERFRASNDQAVGAMAAACYSAAVVSVQRVFGEGHIRVSKTLREKALLLELVGEQHAEVEELLREALAIRSRWRAVLAAEGLPSHDKEDVGTDASARVDMIVALASACFAQGRMEEVAELDAPLMACLGVIEAQLQPGGVARTGSDTETENKPETQLFVQALEHVRTYKLMTGRDVAGLDVMLGLLKGGLDRQEQQQ